MKRRKRSNNILLASALSIASIIAQPVNAQVARLGNNVEYEASANAVVSSGDNAPFWFTNNRYGLGSINNNSGYLRASIRRQAEADSLRKWRIGYGLDVAAPFNHDQKFVLQQLYADFQYKALRLSIGQKERASELRNSLLSTGGMTNGMNARPIPQIRLELPDFWSIPGTRNWLALKGHIAYGAYTDNAWQREYNSLSAIPQANIYSKNALFHSKAGFVRVGNPDKFPLTLTAGLEMDCQFGGTVYNTTYRPKEGETSYVSDEKQLEHGAKDFFHALIPSGSDYNDGDFSNVAGNQLGSWHLRLDYADKKTGWGASFYMEHFFEDHSQMFLQYAWKDMIYGLEVKVPTNPFVSTLLYEHISTMDQSGPIYHDGTSLMAKSIYGVDDYYYHHLYGSWQHAGFSMGNPLLVSPIYNDNGDLTFQDTRIKANHFGISGQPLSDLSYRILFSHLRSLGRYATPAPKPRYGNFLLIEATYKPHQVKGLGITAAYGQNGGELLGRSKGCMLTLSYSGWIK